MDPLEDLSKEDIIFLRAIRDINANPDEYEGTDQGEMPANKVSIRKATNLSSQQVEYRFRDRGFEKNDEDGEGLILIYGPTLNEKPGMFGPKSAELTQKGVKALSEWDEAGLLSGGTSKDTEDETIKQLRARVESLEEQLQAKADGGGVDSAIVGEVEELREDVNSLQATIEDSDWGALDDEVVDRLEKLLRGYSASLFILQEVMGFDVQRLAKHEGAVPNDQVAQMRKDAFETLKPDESDPAPEFNPPSIEDTSE